MTGLWTWAAEVYDRPAVAEACLALQDDWGQSPPFLLWAAWSGAEAERLAEGAALARCWETTLVGPLRGLRRALKPEPALLGDPARPQIREAVKALELASERHLLTALERLGPPRAGAEVAKVLTEAAAAWGGSPPPAAALTALVRALDREDAPCRT